MSTSLFLIALYLLTSVLLVAAVLWVVFWKGWALWIACKQNEKWWFIALLVVNTVGLLDLVYVLFIKKKSFNFKTKKFEDKMPIPVQED